MCTLGTAPDEAVAERLHVPLFLLLILSGGYETTAVYIACLSNPSTHLQQNRVERKPWL